MKTVPDFFLGDSEGHPPHWGGEPRACFVLSRPSLPSGKRAWLVQVEPPIPAVLSEPLREVVLTEHYKGEEIEDKGAAWVPVNVCRPTASRLLRKPNLDEDDLVIEYWGELARSPEALPTPIDYRALWRRTLRRIERFIGQHGHSRVPVGYEDDQGPLDIIVGNLRWHHAGRAGASSGPFPGVEYSSDLNRLEGWEW